MVTKARPRRSVARRREPSGMTAPSGAPTSLRRSNYAALSVKDLLEAREHYHAHLSNLENVAATAVGRYRIHQNDWYASHPPDVPRPAHVPRVRTPRTLFNSVVRPWSWPAVLVFVRRWQHREDFSGQPDQYVPRQLYLPDGRVVPTCLVLVEPDERLPESGTDVGPASGLLGGGYACFRRAQGVQRMGTIACLVSRDGAVFALTNQHVAGSANEHIYSLVRGQPTLIGQSEGLAVTKRTVSSLFPDLPGSRTFLNLDAGLVRVADLNDWTSQVFGIGEIGELFDITPETLTLDLIGLPVRAFGGASGPVEGEVQALFFRYQAVGGFDYIADVLIGPRSGLSGALGLRDPLANPRATETHPGDSGSLWFFDPPREDTRRKDSDCPGVMSPPEQGRRARRLQPLAMQWGGERFVVEGEKTSAFALGTFLSTVCRVLEVDLVRTWSLGHDEYWGKIGHFAIGWKACEQLTATKLRRLMTLNQRRIGFGDERLGEGSAFRIGRGKFVPLADVPDYVWVARSHSEPEGGPRRHEPSQHFADMDGRAADGGPSLLDLCRQDPDNLSALVWRDFFRGFAGKDYGPEEGALPFRVWQIYEAMVAFLKQRRVAEFVAAAGVLAHYVGDASQPLHVSELHHGHLPTVSVNGVRFPVARSTDAFKAYHETREYRIHGIYEQEMLEVDPLAALAALNAELAARSKPKADIRGGYQAALATFELMSATHARLSPETIVDADKPSLPDRQRAERLWARPDIRRHTIASLADSTMLLARLWESAWKEAKASKKIPTSMIVALSEAQVEAIYRRATFLPGLTLAGMAASGKYEPPV